MAPLPLKAIQMSLLDSYKAQATRLSQYIRDSYKIDFKANVAREALAAMHGVSSWRALLRFETLSRPASATPEQVAVTWGTKTGKAALIPATDWARNTLFVGSAEEREAWLCKQAMHHAAECRPGVFVGMSPESASTLIAVGKNSRKLDVRLVEISAFIELLENALAHYGSRRSSRVDSMKGLVSTGGLDYPYSKLARNDEYLQTVAADGIWCLPALPLGHPHKDVESLLFRCFADAVLTIRMDTLTSAEAPQRKHQFTYADIGAFKKSEKPPMRRIWAQASVSDITLLCGSEDYVEPVNRRIFANYLQLNAYPALAKSRGDTPHLKELKELLGSANQILTTDNSRILLVD